MGTAKWAFIKCQRGVDSALPPYLRKFPKCLEGSRSLLQTGGGGLPAIRNVDILARAPRVQANRASSVPDLDAGAAGLELNHLNSAKVVDILCERQVQDVIDVVLQHPLEVLVVLWIYCLNVL